MHRAARYPLQAVVYAGIALAMGIFANGPAYEHFPAQQAQIKLTLVHGAARKEECRRLSAEELAELAPNMRGKFACPRERLPVWIEVKLDDRVLLEALLPPTGLSGDGPSRIYHRFVVTPGQHRLRIRLRDSARTEGYDYQFDREIVLRPEQNMGIDFRPNSGGFVLL